MSFESVQASVVFDDTISDDSVSSHHGSALRWAAPFVFRVALHTDGGQNESKATSQAGCSSVPVHDSHPQPRKQRFRGLASRFVECNNNVVTPFSASDSWMRRPVICWRSCRINSTLCWMNSVESLAPGEHYCDPREAVLERLTHHGGWLEHFMAPWVRRIAEYFSWRKKFLCPWHLFYCYRGLLRSDPNLPSMMNHSARQITTPVALFKDVSLYCRPASSLSSRTVWSRWTRSWSRWKVQPKGATLLWMQRLSSVLWWIFWIKSERPLNAKKSAFMLEICGSAW